ncbi:uncharacterized protein BDR25DRAFT_357024 [Lindgomyces ingoldianus]|uniref:Uncharacterized protein n=1 Tax=Lindgomyces ingoldianus TaxID=673940 RepID=A0ACB6QRG5_9PLEO|nr:uncharacterized protein BDR25DRAFT_357024 [Lindgomyces ingoldianus]KAF2468667.1 hypothetical protein BDR25DRAFT_357024 [Lindgomyces ingoldianus]
MIYQSWKESQTLSFPGANPCRVGYSSFVHPFQPAFSVLPFGDWNNISMIIARVPSTGYLKVSDNIRITRELSCWALSLNSFLLSLDCLQGPVPRNDDTPKGASETTTTRHSQVQTISLTQLEMGSIQIPTLEICRFVNERVSITYLMSLLDNELDLLVDQSGNLEQSFHPLFQSMYPYQNTQPSRAFSLSYVSDPWALSSPAGYVGLESHKLFYHAYLTTFIIPLWIPWLLTLIIYKAKGQAQSAAELHIRRTSNGLSWVHGRPKQVQGQRSPSSKWDFGLS